jgi:rare lipoprotein A
MTAARNTVLLLLAGASLAACTTPMQPKLSNRLPGTSPQASHTPPGQGGKYKVGNPYQVGGIWYVPREDPTYDQTGVASWYGDAFHMKATANGETFDMNAISAAHPTLPMPSMVEVTNLENGKKLVVRLNDRGPFVGGRLIDLSHAAARELGYERQGTARVRVRYLGPAPLNGVAEGVRYAANTTSVPSATTLPASASTDSMGFHPLPPAGSVGASSLPPVSGGSSLPPPRPYAVATTPSTPAYTAPRNATWAPTAMPDYKPPSSTTYSPTYAAAASVRPAAAPSSGVYRIQAAAFSDPGAAQRVADQLASTGPCNVEPVARPEGTVYRVMLTASADEGEAWALRDRVAAIGFADARVIRPF